MDSDYIFEALNRARDRENWRDLLQERLNDTPGFEKAIQEIIETPELLEKFEAEYFSEIDGALFEIQEKFPRHFDPLFNCVQRKVLENSRLEDQMSIINQAMEGRLIFRSDGLLIPLIKEDKIGPQVILQVLRNVFVGNSKDLALSELLKALASYYRENLDLLLAELRERSERNADFDRFCFGVLLSVEPGRQLLPEIRAFYKQDPDLQLKILDAYRWALIISDPKNDIVSTFLNESDTHTDFLLKKVEVAFGILPLVDEDRDSLERILSWLHKVLPRVDYIQIQESIYGSFSYLTKYPELFPICDKLVAYFAKTPNQNWIGWTHVEDYLIARFEYSFDEGIVVLRNIFLRWIVKKPTALSEIHPNRLFNTLEKKLLDSAIFKMLNSQIGDDILFATALVAYFVEVSTLQKIKNQDSIWVMLVVFKFMEPFLDGKQVARLMKFYDLVFVLTDRDTRSFYQRTLCDQAIGYPGECGDQFEAIALTNRSPQMQNAIMAAKEYFDKRKANKDLPSVRFDFPGFREILNKRYADFVQTIQSEAMKGSFLSIIGNSLDVIYGSGFDFPGSDSGPTELSKIETVGPEQNRLTYIRPEKINADHHFAKFKLFIEGKNE